MKVRRIFAGTLAGATLGLGTGALLSNGYSELAPDSHSAGYEAVALNNLNELAENILISLSTLGGTEAGAIIALSCELNMRREDEQLSEPIQIIQRDPNTL